MAAFQTIAPTRRGSGTYLGIFASAYVSLFLTALLVEQVDGTGATLDAALFGLPVAVFTGIGLATMADDGREFFTANRSVSAFVSGWTLAVSALGGVGVVCITGALFKTGIDALALVIGWVSGLVIAGVLLLPFIRKCGAYTIPSFLGMRMDSGAVRLVAAIAAVGPTVLMLGAELSVAAFLAAWVTGLPQAVMVVVVAVAATASVATGGLRASTWVAAVQSIAVVLAMAVPATIVSLLISNLPIPQLMHGILIRSFNHVEAEQTFAAMTSQALMFDMPGAGLDAFTGPYLQAFAHVGRLALPLAIMVIATGLAALPALLVRAGTSTTVYETRKAAGWAVVNLVFLMLTLASIAGFMRGYVVQQIVGIAGNRLPSWFQILQQLGLADLAKAQGLVAMQDISIRRDAAFVALPMAAGMPRAIVMLAAMGALAAALAGASAHIAALAGMLSEDLLHGSRREPPDDRVRLLSARWATGVAGGCGVVVAWMVYDPLAVVLCALALSSATLFPVLVLSIMWRKVSRSGAILGMASGFGVTLVLMVASLTGMIALPPLLAAVVGGPVNLFVMAVFSEAQPMAARRALDVVRDLRLPGGEAIYDREMRVLRRRRAVARD